MWINKNNILIAFLFEAVNNSKHVVIKYNWFLFIESILTQVSITVKTFVTIFLSIAFLITRVAHAKFSNRHSFL